MRYPEYSDSRFNLWTHFTQGRDIPNVVLSRFDFTISISSALRFRYLLGRFVLGLVVYFFKIFSSA